MISVILSTNNEMRNGWQEKIRDSLLSQDVPREIIVVDNGSTDGTWEFWSQYATCISLPCSNRAQRLNRGIQHAQGDIILLHHPVSLIPENTFGSIVEIFKETAWGGYKHSFDHRHWLLRFTSWYSNNCRAKRGILYLDHCIFFDKNKIHKNDLLIPEVDIFEDTLFSYNMRKYGLPKLLPISVMTSARRFTKKGIWIQSIKNQYLKLCFFFGKSDKKMNEVYEKNEGYNVRYH